MVTDSFEVGHHNTAGDRVFPEEIGDVLDHHGQRHVRRDVVDEREEQVTGIADFRSGLFQSFLGHAQR